MRRWRPNTPRGCEGAAYVAAAYIEVGNPLRGDGVLQVVQPQPETNFFKASGFRVWGLGFRV